MQAGDKRGGSPLGQVDSLLLEYDELRVNDTSRARDLKERALVLIRHLSHGDTRLYMSVAKASVAAIPYPGPDRVPQAKARWESNKHIIVSSLRALREGLIVEKWFGERNEVEDRRSDVPASVSELLHPLVIGHSMKHFADGDLREAVLNAMLALAQTLRDRSGADLDGAHLANKVLSARGPILEFTPRQTASEIDEHAGFHHIVLGAFLGVRNPKAHSLMHDLNPMKALQYLVFVSLLLRRVDEARVVKPASNTDEAGET
jgi:uncharacterized protein (TIGR02391 family)